MASSSSTILRTANRSKALRFGCRKSRSTSSEILYSRYAQEDVNRLLVANKVDMEEKRVVSYEEGEALGNLSS
jgi:hypothetical protein